MRVLLSFYLKIGHITDSKTISFKINARNNLTIRNFPSTTNKLYTKNSEENNFAEVIFE